MTNTIAKKAARRGLPSPAVYGTKGAKTGADNEQNQDQEQDHENDDPESPTAAEKTAAEAKAKKIAEAKKNAEKARKAAEKAEREAKALEGGEGTDDPESRSNELSEDQVNAIIGKQLAKTLRAELPKLQKQFVTEEGLKSAINDIVRQMKDDSVAVTKDSIADIVDAAAKAVVEDCGRKAKAAIKDRRDADKGGGEGEIEVPIAWCKGNLPLHGKQLLNIMQKKPMNEGIDESDLVKGKSLGDRAISAIAAHAKMRKALTSTGVGTGDELVPTDLSAELLRRFYLRSNLAAVFMAREIQQPTDPYVFPLNTTRPQFYAETTQNADATPSDPGTGNTTLQTVRVVGETDFSYELDEDSIIAILPMVQMLLAEGAADSWEDMLINGDTTATHQDSDTHAGNAKLPAKFVKGFRKLALAVSALKTDLSSGGVTTNANFLAVRKLLKKYGGDPRNLIWVASPTTAITMQGIAETVSLEKFGSRATIVTGEIAALQGIPIIQSERVREDVNANGVYDGTTTTKGTVLCINTTRFLTGFRRNFTVEVDKNIQSGKNIVVASYRKSFTPIEVPSATVPSVSIGYNFTP